MSFPAYSTSEAEFRWSTTTYRLDELDRRFKLPRVVRLAEGYCSDIEAEGFSKDDIIGIDSKVSLEKVAAHFANRKVTNVSTDDDERSYERLSEEILVPLNYKGKVKIRNQGAKYSTVRELVEDFPRFAKVCKNLPALGADDRPLHVPAGTTIELVQVLKGRESQPDELVIQFQVREKPVYAKVPVSDPGLFRAESDDAEYTIKEVVERFKLPQVVKFIDDEIRKVYTKDILEGIGNMRTITETLQLNRVVTHNVLVGHYKPVDGLEPTDTEKIKKRTLVVLPMDHPEIREIEVNVLEDEGDISDIYERVFNVCNISNSLDVVDTIYVEFSKDTPSPKIFKFDDAAHGHAPTRRQQEQTSVPPPVSRLQKPLPPAPSGKQPPQKAAKPRALEFCPTSKDPADDTSQADYEIMSPAPVSSSPKIQPTTPHATASPKTPTTPKPHTTPKTPTTQTFSWSTKQPPPEPNSRKQHPSAKADTSIVEETANLADYESIENVQTPKKLPPMRKKQTARLELPDDPPEQSQYEILEAKIMPVSCVPPALPPSLPPRRPQRHEPAKAPGNMNEYQNPTPVYEKKGTGPTENEDHSQLGQADYEDMETDVPNQRAPPPPRDVKEIDDYLKPIDRKDLLPIKKGKQPKKTPLTLFDSFKQKIANQYSLIPSKKPLPTLPLTVIEESPVSNDVPPTAVVKPMSPRSSITVADTYKDQFKPFLELNCTELVERLQLGKMQDMANTCENEGLDGRFFASMDNEMLKSVFNLNTITLLKFTKMRDQNWVPHD